MIEISEKDYVDLLLLVLKIKDLDLLDFMLDLLKNPLDIHLLDAEWHDVDLVGDELFELEFILRERKLLK